MNNKRLIALFGCGNVLTKTFTLPFKVTVFILPKIIQTCFANELEGKPSPSPLVEVHLVRIVQEALTNARKHAQANRVDVVISENGDRLHVLIKDDGIGFRLAEKRDQFGLNIMQERAKSGGGLLVVDSNPNKGTIVSLELPLVTPRSG